MSQAECPPGVLRERLSDAVGCARVVRVQRRRRYQSHLMFIDDLELTFVNVCTSEISTVCIDRRYVLEYSGGLTYSEKFAMKIEAFGPDGRRLSILRRDERCLLDREPGLEYLCIRLNEPIKPGNYYVITLTHTAQTLNANVSRESRLGKLMDFLTPYFDVYVFSLIHPINQPPAPWTQSQYHHYEVVPEHLEIHSSMARIVQERLNTIPSGKLSLIASDPKNLAFGFTISGTNNPPPIPIYVRLTLNGLYKAFSWMFQLLSIATIALSWTTSALLLGHTTHLLNTLLTLLTTLALLLLGNYIVIPKQAPIKYLRLQILTYTVMTSIISLITITIIKA
ncbi:hypothetical protein [Vulcanisaeta sp. JCM 14467]|uniref:hypothetical protein n=1 Tax=Vulcanisaeta sp. JCM 14467 TaxID=1295370 RepID=UPI0006D04A45|nr:hypothetical protein [Vulcanisaeta sp. JCM 14467]